MAMMRALVKSRKEPGLWIKGVPELNINDALIKFRAGDIVGDDGFLSVAFSIICLAGKTASPKRKNVGGLIIPELNPQLRWGE